MSKKNLPIKIFEKRKEIDERRVEGGGNSNLPKFVLSDSELYERAEEYSAIVHDKLDDFEKRPQNRKFIPTTLNVEINDKAIAKSHRSEIKKIFNVNYKHNFIGFTGANNLLVKIDSPRDVYEIEKNLRNINKHKIGLSAISHIEDFFPDVRVDKNDGKDLKVTMINYQNLEINNAVKNVFEKFCIDNDLKFKRTNYSPELIIYKIFESTHSTLDKLQEFEAVKSISFMPQFSVGLDFVDTDKTLEIKTPSKDIDYPVIGVLDSGISKNKYLSPWLIDKKFSSYPENYIDDRHGTFVSGVIIYGDELENRKLTGLEGCKLFDATVMPDELIEKISEDELVENIREAIKENSEIKIWNMSLGSKQEADEHNFSHFGQALDSIQETYEVLICKSAGNCTNFKNGNPKSRVSRSADSILSLVVGSIAHNKKINDLAEVDHPSPFTRIGNGPSNIIKPELVSYGGNASVVNGKIVKNGVSSLSSDGKIVSEVGTSFSTPRVSALLASLDMNINEEFNPLLLKALAIHSAKYPSSINMGMNDRVKQMGFGLPAPADEIIYNDEYEITLILQDTLIKGEYMEILEFPFPESLIDDEGYYYGDINLTIVGSPVLRNQGSEYCQSNLEVLFGTYDNIKNRDTTVATIINEFGPDGVENIFRNGAYKAKYKKDFDTDYARERVLLDYGKKYHPIKKFSVNLEGLTPANKENKLKSPKKWFLRVKGLFRDFAEEMASQDGEELSQNYCLILTIKDNKRKHKIYNEVNQLLSNGNFNHSNINLREEVRVNNITR
ncbi:S8 family peptidase [uncultured Maribacter sp.]|uniref:S8 family peptidase n=1 Tax=uncultured Maribacter sp. TaxID=431308 RepID=UPI00262BAE0D|nr:S8 family peptidase [uncultured Maribacter sp.]